MDTEAHQMVSEVATMVIVLLSPTLQTRDMDKLSTAHLGITQMGIIRGTVTSRTTNVELVRDPEECQEAALKQCDPEKAFS